MSGRISISGRRSRSNGFGTASTMFWLRLKVELAPSAIIQRSPFMYKDSGSVELNSCSTNFTPKDFNWKLKKFSSAEQESWRNCSLEEIFVRVTPVDVVLNDEKP